MIFPFQTKGGARFRCEADLAQGPVVNLDFCDPVAGSIPFHVSVRRDEGCVVVNRRNAQGWRRELVYAMPLAAAPLAVEVSFASGRAALRIGGRLLGRFDALARPSRAGRFFLRRGFPGMARIGAVTLMGPIVEGSLALRCPALAPPEGVRFDPSLCVSLRGLTPQQAAQMTRGTPQLRQIATGETIPATLRALPHDLGQGAETRHEQALVAVPPGHWWDAGMVLALCDGAGRELGRVALAAEALVAHLDGMARAGVLAEDLAALQAIEHARHAAILPRLTAPTLAALVAAAERFGLSEFLLGNASLPAPAPDPQAAARPVDPARDAFTQAMRQSPAADPAALLRALMARHALPRDQRADLLIALVEWFAARDRVGVLTQLWRDEGLPPPEPGAVGDQWRDSALLVLDHAQGRFDRVAEGLTRLAAPAPGWLVSPAIGWIAAQVAQPGPGAPVPNFAQRLAITRALMGFVERRAVEYWGRTPCLVLLRGMVGLLAQSLNLPQDLAEALSWLMLRVYGLAPRFWEAVDLAEADGYAPPERVVRARTRFRLLQALIAAEAGQDAQGRRALADLLATFRQLGALDYARFARDLLGPASVALAEGELPDPDDCLAAGLDPDEAALRFLAFPRAAPDPEAMPPALAEAARRGLRAAYAQTPRGRFADLQQGLMRDAAALLAAPDPAATARLHRQLPALADRHGALLGLGLAVSLVRGLIDRARLPEAESMAQRLETMTAALTDPWDHAAHRWSPAPTLALAALRRAYPDHPLTARLIRALAPLTGTPPPPPIHDLTADLAPAASPLFDTLVCLYSCRANLDTRVAAIRAGWMSLLPDLGVPCLVFVGAGDGTRQGDVVHLDAPDDYEGLPDKTLAMVRWVLDNTAFSHLLKVDDDCFLAPEAFFGALDHLKFDYYGRKLTRVRGQMDRTWHMAKARSPRGRLGLDKSPEPSFYADGGSGYTLSRRAMAAVLDAAASPEGQALRHLSFMEDKLVGDLLALRQIAVQDEDYRVTVLRQTHPGGPLVAQWENGFLPFAGSGIKLAHLDGHERQAEVLAVSRQPWPRPHKIWPTMQALRLGSRSNTLDLISTPERLARVNAAPVAVVACLRNEAGMIGHFLAHYRALGVQGFLIADNGSDDGTFEHLRDQPDVALFAVDTDYSLSQYGVAWQQALMANFRVNRWSLVADADELLVWNTAPGGDLAELLAGPDFAGADAARVFMLDMYPGGRLDAADFTRAGPFEQAPFVDHEPFAAISGALGPFSDAPTWTSALRHRLIPGSRAELFVAQKIALLKYQPWMRPSAGLHFVAEVTLARRDLLFAHFKYNAAFHAKARAEVTRRQHFNNAEEYRKYLALLGEGRDVLFDPRISVRWDECAVVRTLCAGGRIGEPR